jgi:hypothetical protein
MISRLLLIVGLLLPLPLSTPALAQEEDIGNAEVVVTAMRRDSGNFSESVPVIGLRKRADFAIQTVTITGDTRDETQRREEMAQMLRSAIDRAAAHGVELATGSTVVEPVNSSNYRNLPLLRDGRPDAERYVFLVKVPLADGVDATTALARIGAYIRSVQPVGRALMQRSGDLTLSVVRPDQYGGEIVGLIAADAREQAGQFGPGYAVEAVGLQRPVEWSRVGLIDVFLYIPYTLTVVPAR